MFPSTSDPADSTTRFLRSAVRNAADLVIAFMTLDSYGLDDLRPSAPPSTNGDFATPTDKATARPDPSPIDPSVAGRERAPGQRDMLVQEPRPGRQHPHRHDLRPPRRPGRPGASAAREQLCLTPLPSTRVQRPADSPQPRPSTAPQEASH